MRHGKKDNHLSRTHSHREAMLSNMASSLILHKRIETTVAKAKELRKFVEPILTRSKEDTNLNRRITFRDLQDVKTMKELFGVVADKIANRPGGYTRIIKLGNRAGDNAETLLSATEEKATKTRRSRRGSGSRKADGDFATTVESTPVVATTTAEPVAAVTETPIADVEDTIDVDTTPVASVDAETTDTTPTDSTETSTDEEPKQS